MTLLEPFTEMYQLHELGRLRDAIAFAQQPVVASHPDVLLLLLRSYMWLGRYQ